MSSLARRLTAGVCAVLIGAAALPPGASAADDGPKAAVIPQRAELSGQAGEAEANILHVLLLTQAAAMLKTKLPAGGSFLVAYADESFDTSAYDAYVRQAEGLKADMAAAEAAPCETTKALENNYYSEGLGRVTGELQGAINLLTYFTTSYDVHAVTITPQKEALLNAVVAALSDRQARRRSLVIGKAVVAAEVARLKTLQDGAARITAACDDKTRPKAAKAWLASAHAFADGLKPGKDDPMGTILRQAQLAQDMDGRTLLLVGEGPLGGTIYVEKSLWTLFGGMPVKVSAASTLTARWRAPSGEEGAATIVCHSPFTPLGKVADLDALKAGRCVAA